jgi:pimeloyl-ACP methyl ester carboxylesterase/DNA-binding CsgD family transcriptional regulator
MTLTMDAPPVQYAKTSDGYSIAYSVSGAGLPFIFMPQVTNHVQLARMPGSYLHDWLAALQGQYRLVQYDGRGQGMSSRGLDASYSMESLERDLESVVDCLKLDRFVLMGVNATGHAAIRFSIRKPGRVAALILSCCSTSGRAWPVINSLDLAARNWELFPGIFMSAMRAPTQELRQMEMDHFRQSVTQADWLTMAPAWASFEIGEELSRLATPALILHPRNYENMPPQRSIEAAARIPGARLVLIDGVHELGDAASGIPAIEGFLRDVLPGDIADLPGLSAPREPATTVAAEPPRAHLSRRQVEVLHLLAQGKTNREIADALVLSERTVQRHIANLYARIRVRNRAEATAFELKGSKTPASQLGVSAQ